MKAPPRKLRAYICNLVMWWQFSSAQQDEGASTPTPNPTTATTHCRGSSRRYTSRSRDTFPPYLSPDRRHGSLPWWFSFVPPPRHYHDGFSRQSHETVLTLTILLSVHLFLKVRMITVSLCVPFNKSCYKIWSRKTAPFLVYSLIFIVTLGNNPEGVFPLSLVIFAVLFWTIFSRFRATLPPPIDHAGLFFYKLKIKMVTHNFSVEFLT